jgi:NAD(P)-dependent dehydrogenase (short-subunit alcohol dehydrogenase family)
MTQPLNGKIAVVTGASRGIGYAFAKALAREGAHVVALARTVGGLEELDDEIKADGGSATLVPVDLKDFAAVDRLGAAIFERWKKLDVLVGNAGVLGRLSPLGHIDPAMWEEVMAVNVTANWRLIRALDPLLRQSEAGRAVFVTSGAAKGGLAYWGPYAVSKAALEALATIYAAETAKTAVRVSLLNPGPVRTRMRAQAMPGEDPNKLPDPQDVADAAVALCLPALKATGSVFDYRNGQLFERT